MEASSQWKEAPMTRRDVQVLIVADDSRTVAALASEVVSRLDANITIVDSIEEARVLIASEAYDLAITSGHLADGRGETLIKPNGIPVVFIEETQNAEQTVEAFRAGAADVVCPGKNADAMISSIRRIVKSSRRQRHTMSRNRRLRRVSRRLIKDRRELRQRVDLICRDIVQAYQRLAEKVVTTAGSAADRE